MERQRKQEALEAEQERKRWGKFHSSRRFLVMVLGKIPRFLWVFFDFFLDENWWFWSDGSRGFGVTSCGSWILRRKESELRNLKNCKVGIFVLRQEEERKRREVEKQENWDSNNISATKERFTRSSLPLLKTMRCTLSVCNHGHHHLVEWHANTPRDRDENRNLFPFLDRTFLVSVGAAQEGSWTAEKHGNVQAFDFFRFYKSQPFRHFPPPWQPWKKPNFHKTNVLPPWKATWKKYRIDSIEKHSMECVLKGADSLQWTKMTFWRLTLSQNSRMLRGGSSRGHLRAPRQAGGTPGIQRNPTRDFWEKNDQTFCYNTTEPVRLEQMKKQAEQKATNVKAATGCQIPPLVFFSRSLCEYVLVYYNILFILLFEDACSSLHV